MEFNQIRAFVTVARIGNLTRAADTLHLTQPAVTAQIKALEHSLGVALFDRAGGKFVISRAGEQLLPVAEALLAHGKQLKSQAQQLQGELHGQVVLGIPGEQADFLRLGELASRFTRSLPLVELHTRVVTNAHLIEHVNGGGLTAALTIAALPPRDVRWMALRRVRYRLAVPHTLMQSSMPRTWQDLAALPWLDGTHGSHVHLLLRELFERHGLSPRVVMNHDDPTNLDALVRAQAGCALLREEIAMAGAQQGDYTLWAQAKIDATLGFATALENTAEPVIVALTSLLASLWNVADP